MKKPIVLLVPALMFALGVTSPGYAQEWPQRPIRVIVSFGPGGGAEEVEKRYGVLERVGNGAQQVGDRGGVDG